MNIYTKEKKTTCNRDAKRTKSRQIQSKSERKIKWERKRVRYEGVGLCLGKEIGEGIGFKVCTLLLKNDQIESAQRLTR